MAAAFVTTSLFAQQNHDYPFKPVPFTKVKITDRFWQPRLETNRVVTIPYNFTKCEETGRIDNFEVAAGMKNGAFIGRRYNDSDVFKIMEGAAYSLANHPDPELEKYLDDLIAKIAGAQEDDGYLYTTRTINPEKPAPYAGDERWSFLDQSHELYNVGHMYEAAVAYYQATGKRNFLDVALKNADLIAKTFGPGKRAGWPGHQEIEIGLVKLYRVTGDEKYLKLAKYFLDARGYKQEGVEKPQKLDVYTQSHLPVLEQTEAVGHAVRALYMYSGMADVAALTGDENYVNVIEKIWENVVGKKLYLTGGIGARHNGEAFGDDYELPNESAYNETCAAIANCFWNQRMFLLKGEAKYYDVLERTLYNGMLSGIALEGNKFFYPNPLACDASYKFNQGALTRKPWFDCSCCPSNIVRFLPSLPGYIYATRGDEVYVNLYVSNEAEIMLTDGRGITIVQETNYPWEGAVRISIDPMKNKLFFMVLKLRVPGWASNRPVPGDLYHYLTESRDSVIVKVNGDSVPLELSDGFVTISRMWKKGDEVTINMPMPVRKVVSHPQVVNNRNYLAIERGPVVYCVEGVDHNGSVTNLILPKDASFSIKWEGELLGGIDIISANIPFFVPGNGGLSIMNQMNKLKAIPYYAWSHRGIGEMAVWLPERVGKIQIKP